MRNIGRVGHAIVANDLVSVCSRDNGFQHDGMRTRDTMDEDHLVDFSLQQENWPGRKERLPAIFMLICSIELCVGLFTPVEGECSVLSSVYSHSSLVGRRRGGLFTLVSEGLEL